MVALIRNFVLSCARKKEPKKHARRHLPVSSHEFKKQARNKTRISCFFYFLNSCSGQLQAGRRVAVPMVFAMALASCGYHLAGHGDGAGVIPADVKTVSLQATNATAETLMPELKRHFLTKRDKGYELVDADKAKDSETHADVRLEQASERFVPTAYDATGVATQYRLIISGNIRIYRSGKLLWESGAISESGDVFVTGGPVGVEASRSRIQRDLRKQWAARAWNRLSSGF
jgi:outer membrane lipopolysaccharide assembly protein LptE/RlpB